MVDKELLPKKLNKIEKENLDRALGYYRHAMSNIEHWEREAKFWEREIMRNCEL